MLDKVTLRKPEEHKERVTVAVTVEEHLHSSVLFKDSMVMLRAGTVEDSDDLDSHEPFQNETEEHDPDDDDVHSHNYENNSKNNSKLSNTNSIVPCTRRKVKKWKKFARVFVTLNSSIGVSYGG